MDLKAKGGNSSCQRQDLQDFRWCCECRKFTQADGKIGQSFGREASQRLLYRGTRAGTANPLSWKLSETETLTRRCKCHLILPWLCTAGLFSRLNIGVDCTGDRWGVSSILMELWLKSKKTRLLKAVLVQMNHKCKAISGAWQTTFIALLSDYKSYL